MNESSAPVLCPSSSVLTLLQWRSVLGGGATTGGVRNSVRWQRVNLQAQWRSRFAVQLLWTSSSSSSSSSRPTRIASPHTAARSTLDVDATEGGRFVLAGSNDATLSIYDMSPTRGADDHETTGQPQPQQQQQQQQRIQQVHSAVARSRRSFATLEGQEVVPTGHSHGVVHAQWYPVDTGAFVSASSAGQVLLWDTNQMAPVTCLQLTDATILRSAAMSPTTEQHMLLATASSRSDIQLCHVASGSSTHTLAGHIGGVRAVAWSPVNPHTLVSGGDDGTIRVWDIRKSGSRSCIAILFQKQQNEQDGLLHPTTAQHKKSTMAPNNYSQAEESSRETAAHSGPVSAICFTPDGRYLTSFGGKDGRLRVWDMAWRCMCPTYFLGPNGLPQIYSGGSPSTTTAAMCCITQPSVARTATLWMGQNQTLLGYDMHGMGGTPDKLLNGHLQALTSIATSSFNDGVRLYSGGADGMILTWGHAPSHNTENDDDENNATLFFAKHRRLQRIRQANRSLDGGRHFSHRPQRPNREPPAQDVDSW